jgi:hypothetical protein
MMNKASLALALALSTAFALPAVAGSPQSTSRIATRRPSVRNALRVSRQALRASNLAVLTSEMYSLAPIAISEANKTAEGLNMRARGLAYGLRNNAPTELERASADHLAWAHGQLAGSHQDFANFPMLLTSGNSHERIGSHVASAHRHADVIEARETLRTSTK